jgi:hypothetical protein
MSGSAFDVVIAAAYLDSGTAGDPPAAGDCPGTSVPAALAASCHDTADGGRAVHPRLISRVTDPATGRTTTVTSVPAETTLTAGTSRALRQALAGGSTGRSGRSTAWAGGLLDTPRGPLSYAVVVETSGGAAPLARVINTAIGETE